MKILISAFTPFNGRKSNTSNEVLKLLTDEYETILLETSYERASIKLKNKINESSPDLVIMLGESNKCEDLVVERLAMNFAHATITDNDGKLLRHQKIDANGADLIETKIDLSLLDDKFKISYHAGTYVCNYLYYQILKSYLNTSLRSVFVHVSTKKEAISYYDNIRELIYLIK